MNKFLKVLLYAGIMVFTGDLLEYLSVGTKLEWMVMMLIIFEVTRIVREEKKCSQ